MAEPSSSAGQAAEAENWDYLALLKDQNQRMVEDIQKIHDSCPKDPGHLKAPVKECKVCYRKIVDRIKHRYLDNPKGEWYADRPIFLQHLKDLIAIVRRGEKDVNDIWHRVMDEKRKWFRECVKKWASTMAGFGLTGKREELLLLHDDRTLEFSDFCESVQRVIDVDMGACPPDSLKRLLDTRSKKKERVKAYIEIFFFPTGKPDVVKEATQKYLTMLDQGVSMRQIIAKMTEDRRQSIGNRAEVETLQQRIDDLTKAKAAWLKQKEEKKKKKAAATKLPQGPPCAVCGTPAVGEGHNVCSVCDIAFEHGIAPETYAWCSPKCQKDDFHKHVDEYHPDCAADDGCIQHYGDDLQDDDLLPHFCKDCLEASTSAAFWCSLKCAEVNYYRHRDEAHPDLERPHHDYEAGQVQEGFDPRTDDLANRDMRVVSVNQVMQDVVDRNAMRASYTLDFDGSAQPGPSHVRITDPDTMDGIEMQGADNSGKGKGKGKEVLRTTEPAANGRYYDSEMTDYATPGAGNRGGDVEMRDADDIGVSQGTGPTRDGPVYVWGDKSPRHRIDPATYKPKEVPGTGGRPGEPLLSPERIDRYMYRRSAEPAGPVERQPARPASTSSHGPTGTATGRSASAEPPKTLPNQPTTTVEVANMGTGIVSTAKKPEEPKNGMAIPSSSRTDPGKEARKVATPVESQPPRHRNDEQRRYADREPARTEDPRKRKQDEARQADRDREYKRARSVGSEEKEEGEI